MQTQQEEAVGPEVVGGGRWPLRRARGSGAAAYNKATRPPSSGAPHNNTCTGFFCCNQVKKDFLMYSMTILAPVILDKRKCW